MDQKAQFKTTLNVSLDVVAEIVSTTLNRLGWSRVFVNEKLRQASAEDKESKLIGKDYWRNESYALIRWRKVSDGIEVEIEVTERQMQWAGYCKGRLEEIVNGLISDVGQLTEVEQDNEPSDMYGSARWASDEDLEEAGYFGDGHKRFILGVDTIGECVSVPERETAMHAVVCGPTGSGKTSTIYIPNLIERTGVSSIVTEATAGDEQPDLFNKTAGFRQLSGQKIYKFNPDDMTSHRINPLQYVKTFDQAVQTAGLIVKNTSNKISYGDQIWETAEKQLLTVLILHAVGQKAHLGSIRRWLCEGADGLAQMMRTSQFVEAQREYEGFYINSSEGFRNGVLSGLMQRLNLWVSPKIVALTEKTDIDIESLANERFTFYLGAPAHKEHLKPLAALVFNFVLNLALEKRFKYPLVLFLDEFTNYGYVPGIAEKLTIIRHRDIPVVLGFQDYVQMRKIYGEEDAGLLFNQPGTKIFFRPRDGNTAKRISDALGNATIVERKVTSSGQIQERKISRQLMNPGEVMALEKGKVIVFTPSTPPILLQTYTWQKYESATAYEPPIFRELEVNEELIRACEEAKAKPEWQTKWEESVSKNKKPKEQDNDDDKTPEY